ncbi:hypothetical protein NCCP1664_07230 [Zafaria cholistanensis]|uniref:DUF5671 domain-containing protein n=1 Tax=Zafaria cholistanensis TaxID=1682741 RepID=A0A5A7NNX0_9MICC|nr:DUF5671 domain-containing protein [Zafaria cholistanensis]GER22226.1 hypothetical protein NCCP1664_07230 [Zafaria cholistanensis]
MSGARPGPGPSAGTTQPTVRRLVVYLLLFALVAIAAGGLGGLLGRLLALGNEFAGSDTAGLARSLAFTLIGGPLAAVLWWAVWRRLAEPAERSALAWGLYLSGIYVVSLVAAASNLLEAAASLVGGGTPAWRPALASGLVWAAVWLWHRQMWRHPSKGPLRLADVPAVAGTAFGLVLGAGATAAALEGVFAAATAAAAAQSGLGRPWWIPTLESCVWALGGLAIWRWHWMREGARGLSTRLADVALAVLGITAAAITALAGAGVAVYVLLRVAFDRTDPLHTLLSPLPGGLAAASVGLLVWRYHHLAARGHSGTVRDAARLLVSGAALAAAASGIGVVLNAALALATTPLAGEDPRTLLLGGLASLLVGGPAWWLAWKPAAAADPAGRRIYLVVVFGASAVVALIALLVVGYRVFEFLLEDASGTGLVDRIRAPLGLLAATGLVAGYHFAIWRSDRAALAPAAAARPRTIARAVLVTGSDAGPLARAITEATGAEVTVWRTAARPAGGGPDAGPGTEALARALGGVEARDVLVLAGPGERIEVIALHR